MQRLLILVLICLLAPPGYPASASNIREPLELTIVHVSDLDRMETRDGRGGLAKLAAVVAQLKADKEIVLVTHGGDALSPSLMSSFDRGRHMVELLNSLPLDLFVLGNHEFDFGPEVLQERLQEASFRVLAANLQTDDGEQFPGVKDRLLLEFGDWKIGVFGLLTPDTLWSSNPGPVTILPELEIAPLAARALRNEGADFVLALAHSDRATDLELLDQGAADLILGGHDHLLHLVNVSGGPALLEAGAQAEHIAVIDLRLEAREEEGTAWSASFNLIDSRQIEPDASVLDRIEGFLAQVEEELGQVLAVTQTQLDSRRGPSRSRETAFANLVADALRAATDADIAIQNGGGLRGEKIYPAGSVITLGDVMSELPFLNQVVVLEVSGHTLREVLEEGLSRAPEPSGSFPQVSGMKLRYDIRRPAGQRLVELLIGGEPLEEDRRYRLAVNGFMAGGGGGYDMLREAKRLPHPSAGLTDSIVLADYLKRQEEVAPAVEGRLEVLP